MKRLYRRIVGLILFFLFISNFVVAKELEGIDLQTVNAVLDIKLHLEDFTAREPVRMLAGAQATTRYAGV